MSAKIINILDGADKKELLEAIDALRKFAENIAINASPDISVVTTTNGSVVNIGNLYEQKITSANMNITDNSAPYIMFTAQVEGTSEAIAEFRIKVNASTVMTYYQKIGIGKSIVSFFYPILGLSAGTYQIDIWTFADADCGTIPKFSAKQIISGQGLTSVEGWTGLINLSAQIPDVKFFTPENSFTLKDFNVTSDIVDIPIAATSISTLMPKFTIPRTNYKFSVANMAANLEIGEYPQFVSANIEDFETIVLKFQSHIIDDETVTNSYVAFNITAYVDDVLVRFNVQNVQVDNYEENGETFANLTLTTDDLSLVKELSIKYDGVQGTLHGAPEIAGYKIPSFETIITIQGEQL